MKEIHTKYFLLHMAAITVIVDLFFISTINIIIKLGKIKSNTLLATFQQYL